MIATPIQSPTVGPGMQDLYQLLDTIIEDMPEKSILAVTSKIISLCEGRFVPAASADKVQIIRDECEYYAANTGGRFGESFMFTIAGNTLIPNAGIDESNAGDVLVLWPEDVQATANKIRAYLRKRFVLKEVGVIITDSTVRPMRVGVSGIALAYSGFKPLHSYVGQPDLFGRPFAVAQSDLVGGLASTAVMIMGEGVESTPLAVLSDLSFIDFVPNDPTFEELQSLRIPLEDDLFAPFLRHVDWLPGGKASEQKHDAKGELS